MDATKSLEIIESMLSETKKSLQKSSFFFLLWGGLLVPAGIAEYFLRDQPYFFAIWGVVGFLGGIISMIYGKKESKRVRTVTAGDRITGYTWGAFTFCLFFSIVFSVYNKMPPHALILMFTAMATFISGGISKFTPFIIGGIMLAIGAILCAFFIEAQYHSLVFSAGILVGYVWPGITLRKLENV